MESYLVALKDLLNDPTSNLAATALGLSFVALFAIILIVILLIWATTSGPQRKGSSRGRTVKNQDTLDAPPAHKQHVRRARQPISQSTRVLIAVALIGSVVAAYAGTSTNDYCTSVCHSMYDAADSNQSSAHASIPCTRCHEGAPVLSAPQAIESRLRSVHLEFTNSEAPGSPILASECLSCHDAILDAPVLGSQAVLMSHREVLDSGMDCTDCHGPQGHLGQSLVIGMSVCIICHDGNQTSAECSTCHPDGAEASIRITSELFGQPVQLPEKPTCGGCHSEEACDECHGLRMPHPENYADPYQHAMPAAFDAKNDVCYRCHTIYDCSPCHNIPFTAHVSNWFVEHRTQKGEWCRSCHSGLDMCTVCHQ